MERKRKSRPLFWHRFFFPAWKWIIGGPPWLYGWFALVRDEFLPSNVRDSLRIGGIFDMIEWYWWVIIGLSALLMITVAVKSKPHALASATTKTKTPPAWVINARLTDTPHKCTFCGFSYSLLPNDLSDARENTVYMVKNSKCPKCGNVDDILRFYGLTPESKAQPSSNSSILTGGASPSPKCMHPSKRSRKSRGASR